MSVVDQKMRGFSAVAITAIIGVAAIAGVIGYLEYGNTMTQKQATSATNSATNTPATNSQSSKSQGSLKSPKENYNQPTKTQDETRSVVVDTLPTKEKALNGTFLIDGEKRSFKDGLFYNDGYSLRMLPKFLRMIDVNNDSDHDVIIPIVGEKTRLALLRSLEGELASDLGSEVEMPGEIKKVKHLNVDNDVVEVITIKQTSDGGEVPQLLKYAIRDGELVLTTQVQGEGGWVQFENQALGLSFYHPESISFEGRQDYPLGSNELRLTSLNFQTNRGYTVDVVIKYNETPSSSLHSFQSNQPEYILSSQEVSMSGVNGYYLLRELPGQYDELLHTYLLQYGDDVIKMIIEAGAVKNPVLIVETLEKI